MMNKKKTGTVPTLPPHIAAIDTEIADALERHTSAEERVARLGAVLSEEVEAKAAVDALIGVPNPKGLSKLLERAKIAEAAAESARNVMGDADAAVRAADADIKDLQTERRFAVLNHVLARANGLGEEYHAAFVNLCRLHDELVGLGNALESRGYLRTLRQTNETVKAPTFDMDALGAPGRPIGQYLKHQPNVEAIHASAELWSEIITSLGVDGAVTHPDTPITLTQRGATHTGLHEPWTEQKPGERDRTEIDVVALMDKEAAGERESDSWRRSSSQHESNAGDIAAAVIRKLAEKVKTKAS